MSLDSALRAIVHDPREWCLTGLVRRVEDSTDFGSLLTVELVDGRRVEARPAYVAGTWSPYAVGDEVLVLAPGGDVNRAVALASMPTSRPQQPESVHGVLLRPLLDDLVTLVDGIVAVIDAFTSSAVTTGAPDSGATFKGNLIANTADAKVSLLQIKAALNQSKAGDGGAPHCSPALRATDQG